MKSSVTLTIFLKYSRNLPMLSLRFLIKGKPKIVIILTQGTGHSGNTMNVCSPKILLAVEAIVWFLQIPLLRFWRNGTEQLNSVNFVQLFSFYMRCGLAHRSLDTLYSSLWSYFLKFHRSNRETGLRQHLLETWILSLNHKRHLVGKSKEK